MVLRECQRVLQPDGVLTVCVPHYLGRMAYHDLTHRTLWTANTWKNIFDTRFYDNAHHGGKDIQALDLRLNLVCGTDEANMVLLSQLVKKT